MNLEICHSFREVYLVLMQYNKYANLAYFIQRVLDRYDVNLCSLKSFKQAMRFENTELFRKSGMEFDTKTHLVRLTACLEVDKKVINLLFHEDGMIAFNVMRDRTHLVSGNLYLGKQGDEHLLDTLLTYLK